MHVHLTFIAEGRPTFCIRWLPSFCCGLKRCTVQRLRAAATMSAANMVLGSSRAGVRVGASRPSTTCPLQRHARQQQRRGSRLLARYQPGPFDKWFSSLVSKPQQSAGTDEEPMMGNATHEQQQQVQQEMQAPAVQAAPAAVHAKAPPPKMRDYLEARQVSIYQLLDSEDMKFDIPVYQRPYSWGTKQVFEMLQDFLSAYSAKQEYFLGAIVTVRGSDNPTSAYQVIDGQQRLTSLFIMLACLHNWAKQQGNDVLQQRVWRMLHMEADPLDSSSSSRYRLRLREADDDFFRANVMEAFLPTHFEFTGTARLQQDDVHTSHTAHTSAHTNGTHSPPTNTDTDTDADSGSGSMYSSGVASFDSSATSSLGSAAAAAAAAPSPLEAEVHWRLYQNAEFLRAHMQALVTNQGLNLQDFMFHVLRNCYVVVMTARDEASSFRIFSTLNSRGVDLSEVDKLKADLLQVLEPSERAEYGAQWAEMENLLGRQQFHRVFSYMKDLASVLESQLSNQTVLEYFTRDLSRHSASQVIRVALDYAKILLQMRQARWAGPAAAPVQPAAAAPPAPPALAAEGVEAVEGAAAVAVNDSGEGGEGDLEEGVYMDGVGSVTARVHGFDGGSVGSEEVSTTPSTGHAGHQHAPAAAVGDEEAVGAESVGSVERGVEEERGADVATLLAALGEQSRHLNVLQEEDWVPATLEFMLQVEDPALRLRFLHSVETLTMFLGLCGDAALRANRWRRVTLALLRRPLDPQAVLQAVALTAEDKATFLSRLDSKDLAATVDERTLTHLLLRAEYADDGAGTAASTSAQQGQQQQRFTVDQVRLHRMLPQQPPDGSAWRRHKLFLPVPAATPSTPSASQDPQQQQQQQQQEAEPGTWQECKYWFEVQRLSWQGKLGNLVLLPVRATGASAVASADYEKKAEFIRQCGAEELLPRFSGAVSSPDGRYARQKFSPDECRQRHADVIAALTTLYDLA